MAALQTGGLTHVPVATLPPPRLRDLLGDGYTEVEAGIKRAAELFTGRVVWHVNSTARGGSVVELLQPLLAYTRGAGVDALGRGLGLPGFLRGHEANSQPSPRLPGRRRRAG